MERRTHVVASYALLCVVAAVFLNLSFGPAVEIRREFRADLAADRESYARFNATIEAARTATAENETRTETVDRSGFFSADTSALAAAELQSRLRTLIDERHGTVASMSIVSTTEEGLFPPAGVTASFQCSVDSLLELLYTIETDTPALFVDELSVQSLHQKGRALATRDIELEVRLTVRGYRYVSVPGPEERS